MVNRHVTSCPPIPAERKVTVDKKVKIGVRASTSRLLKNWAVEADQELSLLTYRSDSPAVLPKAYRSSDPGRK